MSCVSFLILLTKLLLNNKAAGMMNRRIRAKRTSILERMYRAPINWQVVIITLGMPRHKTSETLGTSSINLLRMSPE